MFQKFGILYILSVVLTEKTERKNKLKRRLPEGQWVKRRGRDEIQRYCSIVKMRQTVTQDSRQTFSTERSSARPARPSISAAIPVCEMRRKVR